MLRGKRIVAVVLAVLLVVTMMPISAGKAKAATSDSDAYKLIVNTGGKGNIKIADYAESWYPGLLSMKDGEPNVVYIDKEVLSETPEWFNLGYVTWLLELPESKGYHNGAPYDYDAYSFIDPSNIHDYDTYDEQREAVEEAMIEEVAVNDTITIYAIWFKELESMNLSLIAPLCGDELGEESMPQVAVPRGEKWELIEDPWATFWGVWYQDEEYPEWGWYERYMGNVEGGKDYTAVVGLHCSEYGFYFGRGLKPSDIHVTYTDWEGKTASGVVERIVRTEDEEEGSEIGYGQIAVKIKAQHVPGEKITKDVVKPTCTKNGSHTEIYNCKKCQKEFINRKIVDKATGHNWGPWKVTKKPTKYKKGEKQRVCKNDPSHVQKKSIPATGVNDILLVTMKAKGSNKLKLKWNKIKGAKGYDIYFTRCNHNGKKTKFKKLKTVKGTKYTIKGLKANTAYKAYVKAWTKKKGKKKIVITSPKSHVFTSGGSDKFTNAKSVSAKKKKVIIKKKQSKKVKVRVKKLSAKKIMSKGHTAKIRFKTTNRTIARVSKTGKIKGVGKGTCYVYAFAHNGAFKKIKVKVK